MSAQINARDALRLLPDDYASVQAEVVTDTRTPEQIAEDEAIRLQAETQGVNVIKEGRTLARKVLLRTRHDGAPDEHRQGRMFGVSDRVGLLPLAEFAYHANSGMDTGDMGALAAIYEMLKDCIRPEEWDAFRAYAKLIKADTEDLMDVVSQTTELLTAHPTEPESGFSRPSHTTAPSTTDNYSGQAAGLVPVADLGRLASGV